MADKEIADFSTSTTFTGSFYLLMQQSKGVAFVKASISAILTKGFAATFGATSAASLAATDSTASTSTTTGALKSAGGLGVVGAGFFGGLLDAVGLSRFSGFLLRPASGTSTTVGATFTRASGAPGSSAETGAQYHRSSAGRGTSVYMNVDGSTGWVPYAGFDRNATASWPSATASGWQIWDSTLNHPAYADGASAVYSVGQINTTEELTGAGAISRSKRETTLNNGTAGTFAVTLSAPIAEYRNFRKTITMTAGDGTKTVTLALTNVVGGSAATTATFSAAGHTLILEAVRTSTSAFKWLVVKEYGVVLT